MISSIEHAGVPLISVSLELHPLTNEELRVALRERAIMAALSFGLVDPEPPK